MKHLLIMLCSIMLYGHNNAQLQNPAALDDEEWIFTQSIEGKGIGSGTFWRFFSNNTFHATHWYSGGAYWKNQYTGTYYYDPVTATVYLNYKKDTKLPPVKKNLCIQIIYDKIDSIGYYVIFHDSWKKQKGKYVSLGEQQIIKHQTPSPVDSSKSFNFSGYTTSFIKRKIPLSKKQ